MCKSSRSSTTLRNESVWRRRKLVAFVSQSEKCQDQDQGRLVSLQKLSHRFCFAVPKGGQGKGTVCSFLLS